VFSPVAPAVMTVFVLGGLGHAGFHKNVRCDSEVGVPAGTAPEKPRPQQQNHKQRQRDPDQYRHILQKRRKTESSWPA